MSTNTTEFLHLFFSTDKKPDVQTIGFTVLFLLVSTYLVYSKFLAKSSTSSSSSKPTTAQPKLSKLYDKSKEVQVDHGDTDLDPQDWLLIEPTYKSRIEAKEKIIRNCHPDYPADKDTRKSTLFVTPEATPAIIEFYEIVMKYLCDKYPTCFKKEDSTITNLITGKDYPVTGTDPVLLQEYLVSNIEEDFIILLKDPTREDEENGTEYFFKGGVFAFAAGFDPRDRFNKPLSFVHGPVPAYAQKLKMSMNRFFNRISRFYVDDANKGHNLPEGHVQEPLKYEDLDFENQVHYRSERQVLTKLPKSGAVVFTIRTYLLPLAEYKRADEWGPAVIQYLSE
ncbi:hypothetical protein Cantr_07361 [Candida viswanathii]|uniref:Uncharacterized protein n=1 Tax=Candida viswanathii TaxID=5486 RepID=A0A367Y3I8_9ASCO|nr:hypothetical protein Cantr_07361 [Candida viswanathii]